VQSNTRAYNGKASDGIYTKMRPCALDPQSVKTTNLYASAADDLYQCWFHKIDATGAVYYKSFTEPIAAGTIVPVASLQPLLDTLWDDNFNWSWVVFTGLQPNLTNESGSVSALLLRKMYVGFEVQPSMTSPFAATVKSSPPPDFKAMERLTQILWDMPDGEPACNNFFGAALRAAGKFIAPKVFNAIRTRVSAIKNPSVKNAINYMGRAYRDIDSAMEQVMVKRGSGSRRRVNAPRGTNGPIPQRTIPLARDIDRKIDALNRKVDSIAITPRPRPATNSRIPAPLPRRK